MPGRNRFKTAKDRSGVFISYARADGEAFAKRLRERLDAAGVPLVWRDRDEMEGGHDWWLQIAEALENVAFMALVFSPASLKSKTVRREWRYARQEGVCIYPVKSAAGLALGELPGWMSSVHFYSLGTLEGEDVGPEWAAFVNDLNSRCEQPRVPFMAGDLPEDFVERPEEAGRLKALLLDRGRAEPVAVTAALRGAGGFGKTTLARAMCHDDDIIEAFHSGILWVTLGEKPGDLTPHVKDWIESLTGERPDFAGLDAAAARLAELLRDRVMLLVIDDVWDSADLEPFMRGGPGCVRLVTTRKLDTLPGGASRVNVDAMKRAEAVTLLRHGLPGGHDDELLDLATRLGEWPLLLKLANGVLRYRTGDRGQPLADALAFVKADLEENGLVAFDAADPKARGQAVRATLGVSLNQLGEDERARFGELAVFPEDVGVPLATLERLWGRTGGLSPVKTEKLCDRLYLLSLLFDFDPRARRIRLHDVVRNFLIQSRRDQLPALHALLLDAHRPAPARGEAGSAAARWAALPADEPYLWEHLAHHLVEAGRESELHELLASETTKGRNAWYEAKTQARGLAGYLRDVDAASKRAAEHSRRELKRGGAATSLALETRYALVKASISSVTSNMPTDLLVAVAARGVLPPSQVLSYAQGMPHGNRQQGYKKIDVLRSLAGCYDEPLKSEFLQLGFSVIADAGDEEQRAGHINQLSRFLEEPLLGRTLALAQELKDPNLFEQVLAAHAVRYAALGDDARAFELLKEVGNEERRGEALHRMSKYLSLAPLRAAVGLARGLAGRVRDFALAGLVPRLAQLGEAAEALELARTISDPNRLADALGPLGESLGGEQLEQAIELARGIGYYPARTEALGRLAQGLPEPGRTEFLRQLFDEVSGRYDKEGDDAKEKIIRHLTKENLLSGEMEVTPSLRWSDKDQLLAEVAARLAELGCLGEALALAKKGKSSSSLRERLSRVVPLVTEPYVGEVREAIAGMDDLNDREYVLSKFLPRFAALGRAREALAEAINLKVETWRDTAVVGIAPHLDQAGVRAAVQERQVIGDDREQKGAVLQLAPYAPDALLREAVAIVTRGAAGDRLALALAPLGERLPSSGLKQFIADTECIDPAERLTVLLTLAPFLEPRDRDEAVTEVLDSGWEPDDLMWVAPALIRLMPSLDGQLRERVRQTALQSLWMRVRRHGGSVDEYMLESFAPLLVELGDASNALSAAREIVDTVTRVTVLAMLEPFLQSPAREEVRSEVLETVKGENPYDLVLSLWQAAPRLSEPLLREALRAAKEECEPGNVVSELGGLAVRLAELGSPEEALELVYTLPPRRAREYAGALAGVARHLPDPPRLRVLTEALQAACRLQNPINPGKGLVYDRADVLRQIAPQLVELEPEDLYHLWGKALAALASNTRAEFLVDLGALAPVLDRLGGPEAVVGVRDAIRDTGRWWP